VLHIKFFVNKLNNIKMVAKDFGEIRRIPLVDHHQLVQNHASFMLKVFFIRRKSKIFKIFD